MELPVVSGMWSNLPVLPQILNLREQPHRPIPPLRRFLFDLFTQRFCFRTFPLTYLGLLLIPPVHRSHNPTRAILRERDTCLPLLDRYVSMGNSSRWDNGSGS